MDRLERVRLIQELEEVEINYIKKQQAILKSSGKNRKAEPEDNTTKSNVGNFNHNSWSWILGCRLKETSCIRHRCS